VVTKLNALQDIRVYQVITSGSGSKAVAKLLLVWATRVQINALSAVADRQCHGNVYE
jgi:hypothetical protein